MLLNVSPILQQHIERTTNNTNNIRQLKPDLNTGGICPEKKSKKAKIAKIALGSAIGVAFITSMVVAFRSNKICQSLKDGFKDVVNNFKNVSKNQNCKNFSMQAGIENMTNSKDSITRHYLSKIPGYKKFDELTTKLYMKLVNSTMVKKYSKCAQKILNTDSMILEQAKAADSNPKHLKRLEELLLKRREGITNFASAEEVKKRIGILDGLMSDLDEDAFNKLKGILDSTKAKETLENLGKESVVKNRLGYAKNAQKAIMKNFINAGLDQNESKELEKLILKIFKDDSAEVLKNFNKANKYYKKVFNLESVNLFNKLRDIKCGSAPTDILGMIGTAGLFGVYTAQADTKEERVSVSLNTGIPLLVTLGTTFVATNRLISGLKLFSLACASGIISSRASKIIDKKYKEKNNKPVQKTIITLEEFTKNTKDMLYSTTVKPTIEFFKN